MPETSLDAVFFVNAVPTIDYADGLFHVCYKVGKIRTEFVMLPSIYFRALANAVEVSREHGGRSNVVGIHAASDSGKPSK